MKAVVFLGPTLPVDIARQHLDAVYLPPVEQGDILRALRERPDAIGIVDGYFQRVPSVWHKEILTALAEGVYVAGASSMGALRAAELAAFGMVGIGGIFEKFRSGEYTDDDEVAIAHAAADQGYRPLSEAMVNIRDWCARAAEGGILSADEAAMLIRIAKSIHFTQRHWEAVLLQAAAEGLPAGVIGRVKASRAQMLQNAKERDAIALLQHLAAMAGKPRGRKAAPLRVEQTAFLEDLKQQVNREAAPEPEQGPGTALNVARKKVLLGILANREAVRRGLIIRPDDVRNMTDWFRGAYSLADDDRFVTWKANHALPESDFSHAMRCFTDVVRVEEACGPEIDRDLDTYLRVYSAAAQNHNDTPVWLQLNIALGRGEGGAHASARALFRQLQPLLARLEKQGVVVGFHFVRKPPDIRLRIQAAAPDEKLLPALGALFARLQASGTVVSAIRSVYEPETRVFGGPEAMDAVHEYFHQDSSAWIAWDRIAPEERAMSPEQFCTAVIDNLFESALGCGSEVWDAWQNLRDWTRGAGKPDAVNGKPPRTEAPAPGSRERSLLNRYANASRIFSGSIGRVRECGRLGTGQRSLLATMAMFHCNRFGLDGAKQFAMAECAAAAWNPHIEREQNLWQPAQRAR